MGTLRGFASPFGPPPAASSPLASPFGDFGTCTFPTAPARYARALALGLAKPCALAPGLAVAAAAASPWAKPAFADAIQLAPEANVGHRHRRGLAGSCGVENDARLWLTRWGALKQRGDPSFDMISMDRAAKNPHSLGDDAAVVPVGQPWWRIARAAGTAPSLGKLQQRRAGESGC